MEQLFPKDRRPTPNSHHKQAEDLMFEADAAERLGDREKAKELRLRAATHEEKSLALIPLGKVRTRAIIGNSAVALHFKAGNFQGAKDLGVKLLGDPTLIGQDRNLNDI